MKKTSIEALDAGRRKIVEVQMRLHGHKESLEIDLPLGFPGEKLKGLIVDPGVWNPLKASSWVNQVPHCAVNARRLADGGNILEIGCGSGAMGIILALRGNPKRVVFSDISAIAVENTRKNVAKFGVGNTCTVVQGDLFENVPRMRYKCILWMIPFFPGDPGEDTVLGSMMCPPTLIERFFREAHEYLEPGGVLVCPFFDGAGEENNPARIAKEVGGYKTVLCSRFGSSMTIQMGEISIYEFVKL